MSDPATSVSRTYTADGYIASEVLSNGVTRTNTWDSAGRLTKTAYTLTSNGTLIVSYAAQYDAGNRITQITEQPSGAVTTLGYDPVNRITSEARTGANPYSGSYVYDKSGLRTSALVVTNGVTVHNGAYSYDGAGRLSQCVDSATNPPTTEVYVWNPDSTLASYPFGGVPVTATYDEEYRLTALASSGVTAYEYGYAFDNGRRWKKDIAGNVWTWFPCGVQCNAGDLVEETSDLTGQSWAVSATYLRGTGCGGGEIYHRNGEWSCYDTTGTAAVILNGAGAISNSNLYDSFNVLRYVVSGSAQTQWRWLGAFQEEGGLVAGAGGQGDYLCARDAVALPRQPGKPPHHGGGGRAQCMKHCKDIFDQQDKICHEQLQMCLGFGTPADECYAAFALCEGKAADAQKQCMVACIRKYPEPPPPRHKRGHGGVIVV